MNGLKGYIAEKLDIMDVYQVRNENGGIDFMLKIDGTYSADAELMDEMLEFHRAELRGILEFEGLKLGVRVL